MGVLPQNALVERIDFPPPAALFEGRSRSSASAFYFGQPPTAAYAPPQAGEVKCRKPNPLLIATAPISRLRSF